MWFADSENLCVILISYFERNDTRLVLLKEMIQGIVY